MKRNRDLVEFAGIKAGHRQVEVDVEFDDLGNVQRDLLQIPARIQSDLVIDSAKARFCASVR